MRFAKLLLASVPGLVGALLCLSPIPAEAQENLWTSHGPAGVSDLTGVALDPTNPQILYASSHSSEQVGTGLRKSLDGGQTWIELGTAGDPAFSGLTCLAVDPSNSARVYVGTAQGLVAASRDAGATWSKATVGTNPVSSIAVEPATDRVYAAFVPTGNYFAIGGMSFGTGTAVARSTDLGDTWLPTNFRTPGGVYALLADALSETLVAGTDFGYPGGYYGGAVPDGGGISQTQDQGATWTLPATNLGFSVTALAADPVGGHVFAGTSSGQVLRSADAGTWTPLGKLSGTVAAIAVDPVAGSTLYAGLLHGSVWRSTDGGKTWRLFDSGLTGGSVRSLTIDPTGRHLYAGARDGVFHRELPAATAGPCHPGDDHLCLLGSRFRVDLIATDPRTQAPAPAKALPNGERFGYFSIPILTGDPSFPEVFVKMLDATSLPGQGYWLFSSSLTNVPYSLVVTDTTTGRIQFYDGQAFCGTADIQSFPANPPAAVEARGMKTSAPLAASESELTLLSNRFRIGLSATDPSSGNPVPGVAIPQGDRFGYFSLPSLTGDATLPEVFVKMLDATSLPDGDFWLFQGGLTTLPYALIVTDTVTGAVKTYRNDPADPTRLCGSADTRVTTGPAPAVLSGEWAGKATMYDTFQYDETASVTPSGDRLVIVPASSTGLFEGTVRLGTFSGTSWIEPGGCHFEADAGGTANSSSIQVTSGLLSGTCGELTVWQLDLTPKPE